MGKIHLLLPLLRVQRHLTQRGLAERAGVRPDTISALENEKTTAIQFETLARLCAALDCQPGDLLAFEPDAHQVPTLGGPDEDAILLERLHANERIVDGPSFLAELLKLGESASPAGAGRGQ